MRGIIILTFFQVVFGQILCRQMTNDCFRCSNSKMEAGGWRRSQYKGCGWTEPVEEEETLILTWPQ